MQIDKPSIVITVKLLDYLLLYWISAIRHRWSGLFGSA